jgi:transcriptional regulator with XRE-family HTH domain
VSGRRHPLPRVDDQRVGALLRALRIRRGLRQIDVARLAGVSDVTVSRVERGHLAQLSLEILRRVGRALEARLDIGVWTRAGEVERVASARHAALVEEVIAALVDAGWVARPEVSFSMRGERGLIDILAWHPPTRSLLVIEVKTEVVDVGETVGTLDRKRRLAGSIAEGLGWATDSVSCALVVGDTRTNHRRIAEHRATFGAVLPDGGQPFRRFIAAPRGTISAVAYMPIRHPGTARQLTGGSRRVRRPGHPPGRAISRSREAAPTVLVSSRPDASGDPAA